MTTVQAFAFELSHMLFLRLFGYADGTQCDDSTGQSARETQPPNRSEALQPNLAVFQQIDLSSKRVRCACHNCGREILNLIMRMSAHFVVSGEGKDNYSNKQTSGRTLVGARNI